MRKEIDGVTALTDTVSQEYLKLLPRETVSSLSRFKNTKNKLEVKTEVPKFGVNAEDSAQNTNAWTITMDGVVTPSEVTPTEETVSELTEIAFEESRESLNREFF